MDVKITVAVGSRKVSVDQLPNAKVAATLRQTGKEVGAKLGAIACPTHKSVAKNVRIHFDKNGAADLQYDSCCDELGKKIAEALG
jgi:hypothetical protein